MCRVANNKQVLLSTVTTCKAPTNLTVKRRSAAAFKKGRGPLCRHRAVSSSTHTLQWWPFQTMSCELILQQRMLQETDNTERGEQGRERSETTQLCTTHSRREFRKKGRSSAELLSDRRRRLLLSDLGKSRHAGHFCLVANATLTARLGVTQGGGSELVPVADIASAGTCGTSGPRGGQPGRKCGWLVCFLDHNAPPQLISIAQALRSVVVETRPTVPATAWLQRRWPGSEERW